MPAEPAFDALLKCLNRSDKTEAEVRRAMLKKGYDGTVLEDAIEKAVGYGYLSDRKFSERYVFFKKSGKGKYRLKQELLQKGVAEDVANDALTGYTDSAETCENLAIRYMKNKEWDQKTAEKLLRHLIQRGFDYEEARRAAGIAKEYALKKEDFEIPID